jgi:hypothetical protein
VLDRTVQLEGSLVKDAQGPQLEGGLVKDAQGTQLEGGLVKDAQGPRLEGGLVKDAQGPQLEGGLVKDAQGPQLEGGVSCSPMDAKGIGQCKMVIGVAWTGKACVTLTGCSCSGTDCGSLFPTVAKCQEICL